MKTVVITGSTKGIGLGMAREFLKRECSVIISSRNKNKLEQVLENLKETFGSDRVMGRPCDVTDYCQVQVLWDTGKNKFGKIDIWINNAGITHSTKDLKKLDLDEVAPVVNTNLTGLIYGSLVAFKEMNSQGFGQIYNLYGHGSNDKKVSGIHVYGTTKRAVRYFTEALILDAEDTPVKVGSISSGIVVTDFLIDDMRKMPKEQLETVKAIYNCLADNVETVTPFIVENVLKNDKNGAEINWLTDEKANERMNSDEYCNRDLFSRYGL